MNLEEKLQESGLTAARITPDRVESVIVGEQYVVPEGTLLTICILTLKNGFTATGESACVSPDIFNAEIGREIARKRAVEKIYALEGYLLAERVYYSKQECVKWGEGLAWDDLPEQYKERLLETFKDHGRRLYGEPSEH